MISYCAGEIPNDWKLISFSGYSRSEALRYWIFLMSFLWRRIKPPSDTRCFCPSWRPAVIYSSVHIPARSKRVPCLSTTDGDKIKETLFCPCSTGVKTKFSRETSELFDSRHWAVCPAEPGRSFFFVFPYSDFSYWQQQPEGYPENCANVGQLAKLPLLWRGVIWNLQSYEKCSTT